MTQHGRLISRVVTFFAAIFAAAGCGGKSGGDRRGSSASGGGRAACADRLSGGEWRAVSPAPAVWTSGGGEAMAGPLAAYVHENQRLLFFAGTGRWESWIPSWDEREKGALVLLDAGTYAVESDDGDSCTVIVRSDHPDEQDDPRWRIRFESTDRFVHHPAAEGNRYRRHRASIERPGTSARPSIAAGDRSGDEPSGDDPTDIYRGLTRK